MLVCFSLKENVPTPTLARNNILKYLSLQSLYLLLPASKLELILVSAIFLLLLLNNAGKHLSTGNFRLLDSSGSSKSVWFSKILECVPPIMSGPRVFILFLYTQLRWNQRNLVKSNGLSRVRMLN